MAAMKPTMRFSLREIFVVTGVVAVVCWSVWRVEQADRVAERTFEAKLADQERLFQARIEAVRQSMGTLPERYSQTLQENMVLQRKLDPWLHNTVPLSIVWPPIQGAKPMAAPWDAPWLRRLDDPSPPQLLP